MNVVILKYRSSCSCKDMILKDLLMFFVQQKDTQFRDNLCKTNQAKKLPSLDNKNQINHRHEKPQGQGYSNGAPWSAVWTGEAS